MVRVTVADMRGAVEQARQYHMLTPTTTAVLGRLLVAASIMGSDLKDEQCSVTLRISGDGPCGTVIAVSDCSGFCRGCIQHADADLPLNEKGKLDVGGAVGEGTLTVIKDLGLKEPYVGMVDLVSGEIAEDITQYLYTSEQQPGVCALGVLVDRDYTVKAAGGFILSLLPGADESVIARVENDIAALPPVTTMLDSGMGAEDIARKALASDFGEIGTVAESGYRCRCSEERVTEMLISLGREELHRLAEEDENAEVACHFCDKVYHVSINNVLAMIEEA
ncbi:MAG: Hsp33 family molecular chaperone HslO [Clostridia bacterium]|nr:Hsp33 family molecular chaperone HslO [Clostridia bacterium]